VSEHDHDIVLFADGNSRNFAKAVNRAVGWRAFLKRFEKPFVTRERRKEFNRLGKDEQDNLKSMAGWFSGAQCEGGYRNLRNILPRNLVTIDMDYVPSHVPDLIRTGYFGVSDYEFVAHSSRRHTPEEPRIRIVIPINRKVTRDEYTAIVRIIGHKIDPDMKWVDPVSYRAAQMMFYPTCSSDDEKHYFFYRNHGEMLDADAILDQFEEEVGDWKDLSLLPRHPDEESLRRHAEKSEDPTEKDGVIGDFCRAYTIFDVMEKFLPNSYIPGDEKSGHPRFTYAGSTSSNGAIVYDDGKFIYSHHGHDPGCDMNLNAFDFLRIHKFGELDQGEKSDKKVTELPSFKAMAEFADGLPPVRKQRVARNYDMTAMFADAGIEALETPDDYEIDLVGNGPKKPTKPRAAVDDESDYDEALKDIHKLVGDGVELPPLITRLKHKPREQPPQDENWLADEVEMTRQGEIISNLPNVATIVYNDPRLRGVAGFNEFTNQIVITRTVKTKIKAVPEISCDDPYNGSRWQDFNDTAYRAILETPAGKGKTGYGMKVTDRDLVGGIALAAKRNSFHPIRDYIRLCRPGPWENVETLLIRYLGVPDNAYHREVAANTMLASVARIFNPGCKFDFAPIIGGKQGIGKSTFVKVLYGSDWFGEIACKLDDKQDIAEEIAGKWGCELPELSAFHKSDHNAAKMFLRRTRDDVRMSYDRRVSEFARQAVFWGTTNDLKVLKDPTGNRSYWMVICEKETFIDVHSLAQEREALWGAAFEEYKRRTGEDFTVELDLSLQSSEAKRIAVQLQEDARTEEVYETWAEKIDIWLDEPLPLKELMAEFGKPMLDFPDDESDQVAGDQLVIRMVFRNSDAAVSLGLPETLTNQQAAQQIQKAVGQPEGWHGGRERFRVQGIRDRWKIRDGATDAEILCGYRLYSEGA
jgi:putative DNA primase/helicase